jgi:hypothetical protein
VKCRLSIFAPLLLVAASGCDERIVEPLFVETLDPGVARLLATGVEPALELSGEMKVSIYENWALIEIDDEGVYVVPRDRLLYVGPK